MKPFSSMPHVQRDFLEHIGKQVSSLRDFSRELAGRAEPDFSLQDEVAVEHLVLPLELRRFPDEEMFNSRAQLDEVFELFDFLVCQFVGSFDESAPLLGLYVSGVALFGIGRYQRPESAEFSIAERCLVFLKASEAVNSISTNVIASFVYELRQHAVRSPADYWDADWVIVSLLATSLALSSRLSTKAELGRELSSYLSKAEWRISVDEKQSDPDYVSEVHAMVKLLQQCGTNALYK